MNTNTKLLIGGSVILVALAGAVIALTLSPQSEEAVEEETAVVTTAAPSKLLYDKDPAQIENIHVKNLTGEFDIKKFDEDAWFVPEFVGHKHSIASLNEALEGAATMTSQQLASENAADMSIYGLDAPRADVTVSFSDSGNSVKTFHIGSDAPSKGLTYVSFDEESTVYAVNTSDIDCFFEDKFYYVAKTVYSAKQPADENDTTDYTKINSITISRKDIDYDIVLEYDIRQDSDEIVSGNSSSHIMTSPVRLDLNPDLAYGVLNNVFDLTASKIAVVSPSDESKSLFGFDDPFATVDFDIAGEKFTLTVGNRYTDENGISTGYYCMADGFDIIYIFDDATIPWVTVMPMDITMTMITSTYIYTIDSIDIVTAEKKAHFDMTGDSSDFEVTSPDADIDTDKFKSYYQFFLKAPAEELFLEETTEKADVTFTIKHAFGTDVVEFIKSDNRKSVIRVNGVTSFKCRSAYTDRLIENLDHLLANEDIIDTW